MTVLGEEDARGKVIVRMNHMPCHNQFRIHLGDLLDHYRLYT